MVYINSNYKKGMSVNVGDTFSYSNDFGTIVDITDNVATIEWESEQAAKNVGDWYTINVDKLMNIMDEVYGDNE